MDRKGNDITFRDLIFPPARTLGSLNDLTTGCPPGWGRVRVSPRGLPTSSDPLARPSGGVGTLTEPNRTRGFSAGLEPPRTARQRGTHRPSPQHLRPGPTSSKDGGSHFKQQGLLVALGQPYASARSSQSTEPHRGPGSLTLRGDADVCSLAGQERAAGGQEAVVGRGSEKKKLLERSCDSHLAYRYWRRVGSNSAYCHRSTGPPQAPPHANWQSE